MKTIKVILILVIFVFSATNIFSLTGFSKKSNIEFAIRNGDSHSLSSYFYEDIQLKMNNKTKIYSKKQAEKIIENFFSSNKPLKYKETSKRENGNYESISGIMETETYTYRIFYRLQEDNGAYLMSSLGITPL